MKKFKCQGCLKGFSDKRRLLGHEAANADPSGVMKCALQIKLDEVQKSLRRIQV